MEPLTVLLATPVLALLGGLVFWAFMKLGDMDTRVQLPEPPLDPVAMDDTVLHQLVSQGRTIEAIKRVRDSTGMDLHEAKAYVERLARRSSPETANERHAMPDPDIEQKVRDLLSQRRKIEAIKRVREATGCGLREAKEYVEAIERQP